MKSGVSGVSVRKAYAEDFEKVYPLLLEFRNPQIRKEDWRHLFTHPWGDFEDHRGYILMKHDEIVGFLGTVFSKRYFNGQEYKFCNLSSWIVKPEYRSKSINLLLPILKLKDYTVTNLTSAESLYHLFKKLGFSDLGLYRFIFPPLPPISFGKTKSHIITNIHKIATYLNNDELLIFNDHINYRCVHLVIATDRGYCYIVATRVIKRGLPFVYIHYISNIHIFAACIYKTILHILSMYKSLGLIVDERFLKGYKFSLAIKNKVPSFKIYKSLSLKPEEIDNLYTEFILLNL